jgi:hypothetical protein
VVHDRLHVFGTADIVRQSKCAGTRETLPLHIGFEPRGQPRAKHEAVHLVESDFFVLEYRLPTEAVAIEAARSRQVRYPKRND